MKPTDVEGLRALARLARIELGEDELARLGPELDRILRAFEVLAGHEAGSLPGDEPSPGRLREDDPRPFPDRGELLEAAPERVDDFYVVPKTVGAEE